MLKDESILTTIKKPLGIEEDYESFDEDVIMLINNAFLDLHQIGIGEEVFSIEGNLETWSDFLGDSMNYEAAKTFIYLSVRLIFDPPQSGPLISSMNSMKDRAEWRLNIQAEEGEEQ